jgi:hypothetical protein
MKSSAGWMLTNFLREEFESQQKELESECNPIMNKEN